MKTYDVFKSQGGFGVALGIYLDSPVMGAIRWFDNETDAKKYAKNKRAYDKAHTQWEKDAILAFSNENKCLQGPSEDDYNLNVGILI